MLFGADKIRRDEEYLEVKRGNLYAKKDQIGDLHLFGWEVFRFLNLTGFKISGRPLEAFSNVSPR